MSPPFKSGETPELQQALDALFAADPDLAHARQVAGALPDRRRPPGLEALLLLIVEQQVSIASARAIWARVEAAIQPLSAQQVLSFSEDELRGMGLSRPKVRYFRSLCEAIVSGALPLDDLPDMATDDVFATLTAVKGIGRWTAEVYLLFCLGRLDIFPAGDVALQAAVHDLKGLERRPTEKELTALAESWRPHRGVAAQLLWRYYGITRKRADPVSVS